MLTEMTPLLLEEDSVGNIFIVDPPLVVLAHLGCRNRDGGSPPLVIPTTPSRAIPAPLVGPLQMFIPPPTGSSRPLTSNTKKKKVRSANLVQPSSRFFPTKLVGKLTAMLFKFRWIVSQRVQLFKIYTSDIHAVHVRGVHLTLKNT